MFVQRKISLHIGYGQSNESMLGTAPRLDGTTTITPDLINANVRHTSIYGEANAGMVVLGTGGTGGQVYGTSIFQKVAEHIALETGWVVKLQSFAKGGTAATDSWCGWDSTNNRIKAPGETGYDPYKYIENLINSIIADVALGYEVWTYTAGHQNDLAAGRPVDQIIAASTHIQQLAIAAGATKVFVGKTPRFIGGSYEAEFDAGGKIHQIAAGVRAQIAGSYAGADLTGNKDTSLCANDNLPYIHLNQMGVCWAAELVMKAMKDQGVLDQPVKGMGQPIATDVSASFTITAANANQLIPVTSATAVEVTVPSDSALNLPVEFNLSLVRKGGGAVSFKPAAGVTLRTPSSLSARTQYSTIGLVKLAPNEWLVTGDLT